ITAGAIRAKEKIAIFGDYDVDGITSTAIRVKFFRELGADVIWHLPDREREGYGVNEAAVRDFAAKGAGLMITVDCGITASREALIARELGMRTVITDHHQPGRDLPQADAVVNPNQRGDSSGLGNLAGVGVAFMFLAALNRVMGHPVMDMMKFMDLVALGTICDTMPLTGLNRAIAASGLKVLDRTLNCGLKALMESTGVRRADVYAAGFMLGPRLNAAGRITDAGLALDLLLTDNSLMAADLVSRLNEMNAKRQSIQNAIMIDADGQAQKQSGKFCIFAAGHGWHGGVMGIVAGRLREKYGVPCCVATISGGVVNGSGRSVSGVDLGRIIRDALEAGLITAGGGHAAAAGFDLAASGSEKFAVFLEERVKLQLGGSRQKPRLATDIGMDAGGATVELCAKLSQLEPFGMGNPEPVLALSGGIWTFAKTIGNGSHFSGNLKTASGNLAVVGFGMSGTPVGKFLLDEANRGAKIRLAGRLKMNDRFGGVQFLLEDAAV
ncbi:MAG: single-stranded-DNA-specific exonuclease RecJ, partial [Rickettsiales bacterium]|nr:single-stranded-DNA-specific exonuclease RecJ [Rickettsiales bacterium]